MIQSYNQNYQVENSYEGLQNQHPHAANHAVTNSMSASYNYIEYPDFQSFLKISLPFKIPVPSA
jgi:hypothetical protein